MPFYLDEVDFAREVAGCRSVLIVPCRFCPAASMAVRNDEPYLEPFRRVLETGSYERLIRRLRDGLQRSGIRVEVFESHLIHQFVLCMWTSRRRRKLSEVAGRHDAVVVLGCEGAVQTVENALGPGRCRVIQGMRSEGLMSVKPRVSFPGRLHLQLESVNPMLRLEPAAGRDAASAPAHTPDDRGATI